MSQTPLTEARERELVEKVELRLALSDTTTKFQQSLDTFLAPLLLKLASPHASVRQAVFNSLKNILSRLNGSTEIKLPVTKLVKQAQNPSTDKNNDPSLESNVALYSLLLASKGIDRITTGEKNDLLPLLMNGISHLASTTEKARMFHIICKILLTWKAPLKGSPEEEKMRDFLHLSNDDDLQFLLSYFTKFFLLNPARPDPNTPTIIPRGYTCPGLAISDVSFFTYEAGVTFTKDQMNKFKFAIFKFVCNGFVPDDQLLVKFLAVCSTDKSTISDSALQFWKRLSIPYEDQDFIQYLIDLYTGIKTTGIPPVNPLLQEKILSILNSSVIATSNAQNVSLICSIGLHSSEHKLRSQCLNFIRHVAKYNHQNLLPTDTDSINTNIASLIRNNLHAEGWPKLQLGESTPAFNTTILQRRLQYETLGDILMKEFSLVEDLSFIEFLFDSLQGDLSEFRASIQEALISLTPHLRKLPSSSKDKLKGILKNLLSDDFNLQEASSDQNTKDSTMACRFVAIKFSNAAFEFSDPEARMFNIWGTSRNNKFDVIEESWKGLHPYWYRVNQASNNNNIIKTEDRLASKIEETEFPDFEDFVILLLKELNIAETSKTATLHDCLNTAVRFLKQILISQSIKGESTIVVQDQDWSVRIDKGIEVDDKIPELMKSHIARLDQDLLVKLLRRICSEFVIKNDVGNVISLSNYQDFVFGETLLMFVKLSNILLLQKVQDFSLDLLHYIEGIQVNNNKDLEIAATCLGIIISSVEQATETESMMKPLSQSDIASIPLSTLYVASYVLPRLYLRNKINLIPSSYIETLVTAVLQHLAENKSKPIILNLIGQICKYGLLLTLTSTARINFLEAVFQSLENKLINDELAIEQWGYLSLYSNEMNNFEKVFEKLAF